MNNIVGFITWKACESCRHLVHDGGCDSLDDNIIREGDFMVCTDYISSEE